MLDGWSTPRPDRFNPGKQTRYPLYRRLGGPLRRYGRVWKISLPPGWDPRTAQPIASRFTDWAIPTHAEPLVVTSKLYTYPVPPVIRRWPWDFVSFVVYYFCFCSVFAAPIITIISCLGFGCVSDVPIPLYLKNLYFNLLVPEIYI